MIRLRNAGNVARPMRDDVDACAPPRAVVEDARAADRANRLAEFLRLGIAIARIKFGAGGPLSLDVEILALQRRRMGR